MKKIITAVLLLVFCCSLSTVHAEVSKEKREQIEKMLRLTGMEKLMAQMKTQMIDNFRQKITDVPQDFWTKLEQRMDPKELLEKIIPIYDKYYTVEDLKAVNAFYESPAGQKVLSTLPQVMQESMKAGQEWGEKIGKQIAAEAEKARRKQTPL